MTEQQLADGLRSWFAAEVGAGEAPASLVASVHRIPANQRRPTWLPGRERMNRMMLALGGVAAAVALAVIAAGLFFGLKFTSPGVGGPPSSTASPTAVASPTASPTPAPSVAARVLPANGAVEPGRYFVEHQAYRYTFTVSGADWESLGGTVAKGDDEGNPPDFAALAIWGEVSTLYTEPCQWTGTLVTPGPTVDDFATALAALEGFDASGPTDVVVDSYSGKHLQLVVPDDVEFAGCDSSEYRSWEGRYYQGAGQVDDIWILDLDGIRQQFLTTYLPATTAETQTQLEEMVESLEIEQVGD